METSDIMKISKIYNENTISIIEWLMYMLGYTLVLIIVSYVFDSMYIDLSHHYIYALIIVLIVSILNKTVKPLLVRLTIPITGITLGLFYPFINLFILKLADWILGKHFQLHNFWIALIISILVSFINILLDHLIYKPLFKKLRKTGDRVE